MKCNDPPGHERVTLTDKCQTGFPVHKHLVSISRARTLAHQPSYSPEKLDDELRLTWQSPDVMTFAVLGAGCEAERRAWGLRIEGLPTTQSLHLSHHYITISKANVFLSCNFVVCLWLF